VLEPDGIARGTYLRTLRSGEIGFNRASDHWVDVAAFEDGLRDVLRTNPQRPQAMDWTGAENAVAHYTGDLLEGFYDDWALRERERLRLGYLSALGRLLQHYSESGAIDLGLACAWRILELDPLREEVHREVMRLHLRTGHRALAAQQYERCRGLLARELEAAPMEETRQLYVEITGESDRVVIPRTSLPSQRDLLSPLRAAAMRLDAAREELGRAIRIAEEEQDGSAR
jgi:DNA-binding SARP family transcriptional activator